MENLNQNRSSYRKFVKKNPGRRLVLSNLLFFSGEKLQSKHTHGWKCEIVSTNMAPMRHNMAWGPNTAAKLLARPRPSFWVPRLHPFIVNLCAVSEPTNPAGAPSSEEANTADEHRTEEAVWAKQRPTPEPPTDSVMCKNRKPLPPAQASNLLRRSSTKRQIPVLALVAASIFP